MQLSLALVGPVFIGADLRLGGSFTGGQAGKRVHPGDRHLDLLPQQAEHVRRLGEEPAAHDIASHTPTTAAASTAVTGRVTIQPSAIDRTTA